jgi:hypothetical protein
MLMTGSEQRKARHLETAIGTDEFKAKNPVGHLAAITFAISIGQR